MCLFCQIASKEIPSKTVFEDDDLFAFHDIRPGAPVHVLVVPKRHITGLPEATAEDRELLGKMLLSAKRVADATGIAQGGYRVVFNVGPDAGQSVFHVHMHVLGGRPLSWPPG
ncbi:MAG TPA: histidine triad nucleotide-binding protein [Minicystis sp.]|nr:histidine triad nucleotide-binding protein [Minicystis sp.]